MCVHLFAFSWVATCEISIAALEFHSYTLTPLTDAEEKEKQRALATLFFHFLSLPGRVGVLFTMLLMFVRSSKTVSKTQKKRIAKEFMLVFCKNEDLQQLNQQRIELYLQ